MSPHQLFLLRCRQGKKIIDCDVEDFSEIFNKICDFVGVKFYSEIETNQTCLKFSQLLKDFWPNKFMKEVLGSYFLATKGLLFDLENNTIKVFPMVDIRTCSDFLNAFDRHFSKSFESEMKSQKFYFEREEDKRPTKEEIEKRFLRAFEKSLEIVKNGSDYNLAGTDLFIYSELKQRGIIELSEEEMEAEINAALKVYKSNLNIERIDPKTNHGRKHDLIRLIDSILPDDVRVINLAKRKILNDYLKSFVLSELTVKEILK